MQLIRSLFPNFTRLLVRPSRSGFPRLKKSFERQKSRMNPDLNRTALGIFLKRPVPGQVKSRLGAVLGYEQAAELYACFIADIIDRFESLAEKTILAYAPAEERIEEWLPEIRESTGVWPQPEGPLGERLARFFETTLGDASVQRAVVIGTDSPTLPREYLVEAFRLLESSDCVIGPSADGGYYLLGLSSPQPRLFDGIDWSSAEVLQQTTERIFAADLTMKTLPLWYDVDESDNLRMLRGHLSALARSGHTDLPQRTRAWIAACDWFGTS